MTETEEKLFEEIRLKILFPSPLDSIDLPKSKTKKMNSKPHEIAKIPPRFKRKEMQCKMTASRTGKQCKNQAEAGADYCHAHLKVKSFVFDRERNDRLRKIFLTTFIEDPLPPEVHDLVCGAKTRRGTPCKRRDLYAGGRCRLHGGLSTGPRTKKGKKQSSLNWKKRYLNK